MNQPVVAVWLPQLKLLFYQECGLDTVAAERLAPDARRYPALELASEQGPGRELRFAAVYAPEHAGLAYPPGVTHTVREEYQVQSDYLLITRVKMELAQ